MSRTQSNQKATTAASRAWQRARQTAEQAKPVAAQVKPLGDSTRTAASRGMHRARAWAAPQVERTGHVLEDTVAPKVSAFLTKSARRLEPAKQRRPWRKLAGISAALMAALTAGAAAYRKRRSHGDTTAGAQADAAGQTAPSADGEKAAHTS